MAALSQQVGLIRNVINDRDFIGDRRMATTVCIRLAAGEASSADWAGRSLVLRAFRVFVDRFDQILIASGLFPARRIARWWSQVLGRSSQFSELAATCWDAVTISPDQCSGCLTNWLNWRESWLILAQTDMQFLGQVPSPSAISLNMAFSVIEAF